MLTKAVARCFIKHVSFQRLRLCLVFAKRFVYQRVITRESGNSEKVHRNQTLAITHARRVSHWRSPRLEESLQPDRVKLVRGSLLTQQNQRRWASYRVAEDSPQLGGDSPQWPPNSPQLDRLVGLSSEIQGLLPLAESTRKNKKLPVDQLKGIIQQLCEGRWISISEFK